MLLITKVMGMSVLFMAVTLQAKPVSRPSPGFSYFSRSNKLLYNHEIVHTTAKPTTAQRIGKSIGLLGTKAIVATAVASKSKTGPYGMTFFKAKTSKASPSIGNNKNVTLSPVDDKKSAHLKGSHHHNKKEHSIIPAANLDKKLPELIKNEERNSIKKSTNETSTPDLKNTEKLEEEEEEEEEVEGEEEEESSKESSEEDGLGSSSEEGSGSSSEEGLGSSSEEGSGSSSEEDEEESKEEKEKDQEGDASKSNSKDKKTPAGTVYIDSADVFPEMQRLHKKYGITTKGTQLLFISGKGVAQQYQPNSSNKTNSSSLMSKLSNKSAIKIATVAPTTTPKPVDKPSAVTTVAATRRTDWSALSKVTNPQKTATQTSSPITMKPRSQHLFFSGMKKSKGKTLTSSTSIGSHSARISPSSEGKQLANRADDSFPTTSKPVDKLRFFRSSPAARTLTSKNG